MEKDNAKKISLLTDLGNTFFLGNQLDDARDALERVLKIQEETGDKSGMSSTYGNLGSILSQKEDWDASDQSYEKAIALREELSSDSSALLELYSNRAIVLIHLNKLDKAEKLMKQVFEEEKGKGRHPNSKRIDYILVSPSVESRCTNAQILNMEETFYLSDHYPVLAEFEF